MSSGNVGPYLTGFYDESNHEQMFCKTCLLKVSTESPLKIAIKCFSFVKLQTVCLQIYQNELFILKLFI